MSEQQDSVKRMRFTSDFVTIKATLGDQTETFHVHEDVIKGGTEYFRAAFDRKWQEGKAREIEMHEEHPRTISSYLEFLYSKSLASTMSEVEAPSKSSAGTKHLMRLYVFGEKVQDDGFCDEVIRTLAAQCAKEDDQGFQWFPDRAAVDILYSGTPSHSPARRFVVDMLVQNGAPNWLSEDADAYDPEYVLDVARALLAARDQPEDQSPVQQVHKWLKISGSEHDGDSDESISSEESEDNVDSDEHSDSSG